MYQVGEQVLYGIHGICRVIELEDRVVDRKMIQYLVLEPETQPGTKYYVPTHNQAALAKLRRLMSKAELEMLLNSDEVRQDTWIPDENQRKLCYRELINSGDRSQLICMVGTLYRQKEARAAAGRKFHLCDENFLRDAERLLNSEFSMVLGISHDQVGPYIREALQAE